MAAPRRFQSKRTAGAVLLRSIERVLLSLSDCAGGADVHAGTAVFALCRIDHVRAVNFGDGAFGAFGFASTARDAIIRRNNVSHLKESFPYNLLQVGNQSARVE